MSGSTPRGGPLVAVDASADFAYTVHREITSTSVNGAPRDYVLRVTQVHRREDGTWKAACRPRPGRAARRGSRGHPSSETDKPRQVL